MVRILFFVCGVGLGHAGRSQVIIKELMKKHKVRVVSYGDGYNFLQKDFPQMDKLDWFEYKYKKNLKILAHFLKSLEKKEQRQEAKQHKHIFHQFQQPL